MCFILVLTQAHERYPLIIAANRDESRTRPTTPPHRWPGEPAMIAGRDNQAGGTWLGVNAHGLLAAITNRREEEATAPAGAAVPLPSQWETLGEGTPDSRSDDPGVASGSRPHPNPLPEGEGAVESRRRAPADPDLPSRGGLCLGALHQESLDAAAAYVESELHRSRWNPFNLLCATANNAWVRNWRGDTWELAPGAHVITNEGDPDDQSLEMVKRGHELIAAIDYRSMSLDALLAALGGICRDDEGAHPICRPDGERGTVSSSLIALAPDGSLAAYWHAVGPPCRHPYVPLDVSLAP